MHWGAVQQSLIIFFVVTNNTKYLSLFFKDIIKVLFQVNRIFQSAPKKKNQLLVKDKYLDIWGRCLNKVLQKSNGLNKV